MKEYKADICVLNIDVRQTVSLNYLKPKQLIDVKGETE